VSAFVTQQIPHGVADQLVFICSFTVSTWTRHRTTGTKILY